MSNRTISIMLASATVMGASLAGCSSAGDHQAARVSDLNTQTSPAQVDKALAKKDFAQALLLAEQLVTAQPRSGDSRVLLGRAYLANGRYLSARTAFSDAMTLGNRQPRTIISLALCETGLNNATAARSLLAAHASEIPAGDYGLAMAVAGNPQEGVRALLEAVREPDATATTRQNLAYALAMSGLWGQARLMAGQDLSAKEAEARIGQWAWQVLEGKGRDRVVAMVGVAPRADDTGLPTRLALEASPPAGEQLARADNLIIAAGHDADVDAVPIERAAALPAALPAPASQTDRLAVAVANVSAVETAPVAPTARIVATTPSVPRKAAAPRQQIVKPSASQPASFQKIAATASHPAPRNATLQIATTGNSDWVIQLGAFDSKTVARERWQDISTRHALEGLEPVNSVLAYNGRNFYRLAVRGFESRASATSACAILKESGQNCFVRLDDSKAQPAGRGATVAENQPRALKTLAVALR